MSSAASARCAVQCHGVAVGAQDQVDGVDDRAIEVEEEGCEGHTGNLLRDDHQRAMSSTLIGESRCRGCQREVHASRSCINSGSCRDNKSSNSSSSPAVMPDARRVTNASSAASCSPSPRRAARSRRQHQGIRRRAKRSHHQRAQRASRTAASRDRMIGTRIDGAPKQTASTAIGPRSQPPQVFVSRQPDCSRDTAFTTIASTSSRCGPPGRSTADPPQPPRHDPAGAPTATSGANDHTSRVGRCCRRPAAPRSSLPGVLDRECTATAGTEDVTVVSSHATTSGRFGRPLRQTAGLHASRNARQRWHPGG